jgi:hypothetical protein
MTIVSQEKTGVTFSGEVYIFLNLDTFLIHGFAIKILYNKNIMPKE